MNVDTEIRHSRPAEANLFVELGFEPDEAARLLDASDRQIHDIAVQRDTRITDSLPC